MVLSTQKSWQESKFLVLAEIVDIDVELDDVRAFQAPLFFNSLGDNVAFSTAGNDCIHK